MKPSNSDRHTLRPESFPLGSPESRAAARMFAENRQDTRKRIEIVTNVRLPPERGCLGPEGSSKLWVGPWQDCGDVLVRFVHMPAGMDFQEERRGVIDSVVGKWPSEFHGEPRPE
jgi:hypothetical protein